MTQLSTSQVEDPDQLALVADTWTTRGKPRSERFREACLSVARANDGWVDPNKVRAALLSNGELDIEPRAYSALWSVACGRDGYLDKTDRSVPITGPGSRGNGNKSVLLRRWRGAL